jgi:hypothetical protein
MCCLLLAPSHAPGINPSPSTCSFLFFKLQAAAKREAARKCVATIRRDNFWNCLYTIVELLKPLMELLRVFDNPGPTLGLVYHSFGNVRRHLDTFDYDPNNTARNDMLRDTALHVFERRWSILHHPFHAAAYLLNPRFHSHFQDLADSPDAHEPGVQRVLKELKDGMRATLNKMLPAHAVGRAYSEWESYRLMEGIHSADLAGADDMLPWRWWSLRGEGFPTLRTVAVRLLAQPSSTGDAERNWSIHGYIHSKIRNKLSPAKCNALVYAYQNHRLACDLLNTTNDWSAREAEHAKPRPSRVDKEALPASDCEDEEEGAMQSNESSESSDGSSSSSSSNSDGSRSDEEAERRADSYEDAEQRVEGVEAEVAGPSLKRRGSDDEDGPAFFTSREIATAAAARAKRNREEADMRKEISRGQPPKKPRGVTNPTKEKRVVEAVQKKPSSAKMSGHISSSGRRVKPSVKAGGGQTP